jgi:hypothetical protein
VVLNFAAMLVHESPATAVYALVCFAAGAIAAPLVAAAGCAEGCAEGAQYVEFETPGSALERRGGLATSERTMAQRIGEDKFRFVMRGPEAF